jgi:hypothetical protein
MDIGCGGTTEDSFVPPTPLQHANPLLPTSNRFAWEILAVMLYAFLAAYVENFV